MQYSDNILHVFNIYCIGNETASTTEQIEEKKLENKGGKKADSLVHESDALKLFRLKYSAQHYCLAHANILHRDKVIYDNTINMIKVYANYENFHWTSHEMPSHGKSLMAQRQQLQNPCYCWFIRVFVLLVFRSILFRKP